MKKFYQMCVALVLGMLATTTATAGEMISLEKVRFYANGGWASDSKSEPAKGGKATPAWVIGEPTGQPYGDPSVNNFADLSDYTKLVIVASDGTPRIMMNRNMNNGQWNADKSQSHLIEYPKDGWVNDYITTKKGEEEGQTIYTVNLLKIKEDWGFVHLNAIKGANWGNVTVYSMEVEKQTSGWMSLIENGDFEWDELFSFPVSKDGPNNGNTADDVPEIVVDSLDANNPQNRIAKIVSDDNPSETWSTQFFIKLNERLGAGDKFTYTFDVKADAEAKVTTSAQGTPRGYHSGGIIPEFTATTEWATYSGEVTVTEAFAGTDSLGSIAFDLNNYGPSIAYYFDNIDVKIFKIGTKAEFAEDALKIDFGYDTNIAELVKASGMPRLIYPEGTVIVKVDGEEVGVSSVEGFADGRFYVFIEDEFEENATVTITFKNPEDAAYQILFAAGSEKGNPVSSFEDLAASYNGEVAVGDDIVSYLSLTPTLSKSIPEEGSFNLPNNMKEFTLVFDKNVLCGGNAKYAALEATLDGIKLEVSPATGLAKEIKLTYTGADLSDGAHVINVTNIFPEVPISTKIFGKATVTLNFGPVNTTDTPKEMLDPDYFNAAAAASVPEGWNVLFQNAFRPSGSSNGSGARMMDFAAGGDFTKGFYFREGYIEYGTTEGYPLTLEAGKRYNVSFMTAMWKDNGNKTRFEVLTVEEGDTISLLQKVVDNTPNVNGSTGAVNGAASHKIEFVPTKTADYIIRWTSSGSETGASEYKEIILAKPSVMYMPNSAGIEETLLLETALANAIETRDNNADERYAGEAYTALVNAINKYEAEKAGYTAPSAYKEAAADLDQLSKTVKDHVGLCNDYDAAIEKAIDVVRQNEMPDGDPNKATKFVNMELFGTLKTAVEKYHGTSEWKDEADYETNPEAEPVWKLHYSYDKLTDDTELTAAIAELKDIANLTAALFTEGASKVGTTGIAALVDRLRQGGEALKALGVADDDELMVRINNAFTDDDDLAEEVKARITKELYGILKDKDNTLFAQTFDPETGEPTGSATTINMTAFVKNPNIYAISPNKGYSAETVPGWDIPEGKGEIGNAWAFSYTYDDVAQDVFFTKYHADTRMEQTITDLPAGVYTIDVNAVRWDDAESEDCYAYIITNDAEGVETTDQIQLKYYSQYNNAHDNLFEGVVITDGKLTLGSKFSSDGQFFFGRVSLMMTGAAEGFDYSKLPDAIETLDGTPAVKVRAIEMFDVNGRRVMKAQKGLVIMKQIMSDGSIRTQKVVK